MRRREVGLERAERARRETRRRQSEAAGVGPRGIDQWMPLQLTPAIQAYQQANDCLVTADSFRNPNRT